MNLGYTPSGNAAIPTSTTIEPGSSSDDWSQTAIELIPYGEATAAQIQEFGEPVAIQVKADTQDAIGTYTVTLRIEPTTSPEILYE